jgi:flagellin-like protein
MRKLLKSKKALSPVVAAIILIAVTVAVSIAVAAWMGSLTFTFMETEELRITNAEFASSGTPTITVTVQNTGSTPVTVTSAIVNGATETMTETDVGEGASGTIGVTGVDYAAGTSYTIELVTSKGNKFAYTAIADVDAPTA